MIAASADLYPEDAEINPKIIPQGTQSVPGETDRWRKGKESALEFVEGSPRPQKKEASILAGGLERESQKRWFLGDEEVFSLWARKWRAFCHNGQVRIQGGNSDVGQNHLHRSGSSLISEFHCGVFYFFLKYISLRSLFSEDLLV